jgi:hypothetical protein
MAARLNVSLRTIATWETTGRPSGLTLLRLSDLAHEHGRSDLVRIFWEARESVKDRRKREMLEHEQDLWDKLFTRLYRMRLEAGKLADTDAVKRITVLVEEAEQFAKEAQEGAWRNQR